MLYLLWALLNIGLFIFFITTCFRATRLVREKFGMLAAIILVFGLLSFVGNQKLPGKDKKALLESRIWRFTSNDSANNAGHHISIDLDKTLIFTYDLSINYAKDQYGANIPQSATSTMTGLIAGVIWQPTEIFVNRVAENTKLEYLVYGVIEWKLLGSTIYSQPKEYRGLVSIR